MRNYNKIALACCSAAFGLFALTGCEGGEIFEVNAPDWISDKVQEIEDENKQEEEVLNSLRRLAREYDVDVLDLGNRLRPLGPEDGDIFKPQGSTGELSRFPVRRAAELAEALTSALP